MELNKIFPKQTDYSIIHKIKYYPKTKQLQIHYITRTLRIINNVEINDIVYNMYRHHKNFKVVKCKKEFV
jgi:hypothetical protein